MTRLQKGGVVGWAIVALLILTLVSTFLAAPGNTPDAIAGHRHHGDHVACDGKKYTKYVGMGHGPVLARMELHMHACWRKVGLRHGAGKIVRRQTTYHVNFYNTAWGDTLGFRFDHSKSYRTAASSTFIEVQGAHSWTRQCMTVLGRTVCGPTIDFVPMIRFYSPYITEPHMHNGIHKNWKFLWHEGEPGKPAGGADANIWVKNSI